MQPTVCVLLSVLLPGLLGCASTVGAAQLCVGSQTCRYRAK